ncbi:MAG: glutathione S-transferase family protein [Pseudomonadota bacterium]
MKLFYAPGTISIAVAIALKEAGLPFDAVRVDFASAEQTQPEYLALNPKGRVPALVLEEGTVLTETGAILDYIADIAPEAGLRPAEPLAAQHVRAVMFYIASTFHVAHAHKMRGARWADEASSWADMTAKVPRTMAECAAYAETHCLRGDYVLGEDFSIADAYLFVVCNWLAGDGVPLADFPSIDAFLTRMQARDSLKALRAEGLL